MVAWVALSGLVVNGATALLFMRGREGDLNLRSAFVHMASDAVLSAGVLVSALVIMGTGMVWLDPVASLVIVAVIGAGTWGLLRESTNLALDAVPEGLDQDDIASFLGGLQGVREVHDLHVWALSTTETAVTVHLVHDDARPGQVLIEQAVTGLRTRYAIGHATVQLETEACAAGCCLRPAGVV
jgi:cobalt-zinc-cadmium efflux system protein